MRKIISLPKPCSEKWENMTGDEQVRLCTSCNIKVHNLDGLDLEEIRALKKQNGGKLCGRITLGLTLGAGISALSLSSCNPCKTDSNETNSYPRHHPRESPIDTPEPLHDPDRPIYIGKIMIEKNSIHPEPQNHEENTDMV